LAYTDSNLKIGSGGSQNHYMGKSEDGLEMYEVDCVDDDITGFKAYPDGP
jgi:hypothetical protein